MSELNNTNALSRYIDTIMLSNLAHLTNININPKCWYTVETNSKALNHNRELLKRVGSIRLAQVYTLEKLQFIVNELENVKIDESVPRVADLVRSDLTVFKAALKLKECE